MRFLSLGLLVFGVIGFFSIFSPQLPGNGAIAAQLQTNLQEENCRCCHGENLPDRHNILALKPENIPTESLIFNGSCSGSGKICRDDADCDGSEICDIPYSPVVPDVDQDGSFDVNEPYSCNSCHPDDPLTPVIDFTVTRDCRKCHQYETTPPLPAIPEIFGTPDIHHIAALNAGKDCTDCHPALWDEVNQVWYMGMLYNCDIPLYGIIEGQVSDINGNTLEGAKITIPDHAKFSTRSDANGFYVLENVYTKDYSSIRAELNGYVTTDSMPVTVIDGQTLVVNFVMIKISGIDLKSGRIGGTVTINDTQLTDSTDEGYVFKVTKTNGDPFNPVAEDNDGLNTVNWYIIDIPIYDATEQLGGAQPGEQAVIHVYLNSEELTVTNPDNGEFIIGDSGSTEQIDIEAEGSSDIETNNPPSVPQLVYPSNGLNAIGTTIEFKWEKSSDPDGDNVTYNLYVCEDIIFSIGCITKENIASQANKQFYFAGSGLSLLIVGFVLAGGVRDKRKIVLLLTIMVLSTVLLMSCGSSGGGDDNSTPPNNEISQSVSGLKQGITYYWKVVVDDNNGGTVESEVRSFTTK